MSLRAGRLAVARRAELEAYPRIRFVGRLLTSELVANALRHARPPRHEPPAVTVDCAGDRLHVEVSDRGRGFDPLSHLARYRRIGSRRHGIYLVDALADRWGYRRDHGSTVWFEIDLVAGRRPWRGRDPVPQA